MKEQALQHKSLLIIFLVAGLVGVFSLRTVLFKDTKHVTPSDKPGKNETMKDIEAKTNIVVKSRDDLQIYPVGATLPLIINVHAGQKQVVGYDLILTYDPTIVSFVKAENLIKEYDIFPVSSKGKLAITGTIQLQTTKEPVLDHASVATLTFKTLKQGDAQMKISFTPGDTTDSNIIVDSEDALEAVSASPIYVGKGITLTKGRTAALDKSHSLTLEDVVVPDKNCFDCMTSATIIYKNQQNSQKLIFQSGGIAGMMSEPKTVDSYTFQLDSFAQDKVQITYSQH